MAARSGTYSQVGVIGKTTSLFLACVTCLCGGCVEPREGALVPKPAPFDWNDWHPAWSPDGQKIVFNSQRDGDYEIYLMNADGSEQTRLTVDPASDRRPTWSADGSKILFNSDRDGNHNIYWMNLDGTGQSRLTENPADDRRADWSPDGSLIAFDSNRDGNTEIYVMNADGSDQHRLTNSPGRDDYPDWSPDGSKIVFNSRRDGNGEIYVMNADGSDPVRLTVNSHTDQAPRWSADGERIAYFSQRDGDPEIYVIDADGSNQRRLTVSPDWDFMPYWSPDASKIAFDSRRDGRRGIYVMNPDGSDPVKLTNTVLSEFIAWVRIKGIEEAKQRFAQAKAVGEGDRLFLEQELAALAHEQISSGRMREAMELFRLNLEAFPSSSSAYNNLRKASKQAGREVPPAEAAILGIFKDEGIDSGLQAFRDAKARFQDWMIVTEGGVNSLGYQFLNGGQIEDAIRVFEFNVTRHPQSFNVYDSLGEAYMKAGEIEMAIENYRKSLELNPGNTNAAAALQKLTSNP